MPTLPLRPCTASGCPALTATGRCQLHPGPAQRLRTVPDPIDLRRGSPAQRGYGYAWRQTRAVFLKRHPICQHCPAPSTEVDHIIPKRFGGADDETNYQALCGFHHKQKTARERRIKTDTHKAPRGRSNL